MYRVVYQWRHLPTDTVGCHRSVFRSCEQAMETIVRWQNAQWRYEIIEAGKVSTCFDSERYPNTVKHDMS
jgi:hypothetical protein